MRTPEGFGPLHYWEYGPGGERYWIDPDTHKEGTPPAEKAKKQDKKEAKAAKSLKKDNKRYKRQQANKAEKPDSEKPKVRRTGRYDRNTGKEVTVNQADLDAATAARKKEAKRIAAIALEQKRKVLKNAGTTEKELKADAAARDA